MKVKRVKKLIRKHVEYWIHWTGLGYWDINVTLRSGKPKQRHGNYLVGQCFADWRYFAATINLCPKAMTNMSDGEIEAVVIHELMHVMIDEMRTPGHDHEERIATALQKAFSWVKGANHGG